MEHTADKTPASETSSSAEVVREDLSIPRDHPSSNRTGSSTITNLETVKDRGSNGGEMSLADHTRAIEEATLRTSGYHPNSFLVGCSWNNNNDNKEEINRDGKHPNRLSSGVKIGIKDGDSMFEEKSSLEFNSREALKKISSHQVQGPSNVVSDRSKPIRPGFSEFFLGKSKVFTNDKNAGASCETRTKSVSSSCRIAVDQNRNVHDNTNKEASVASRSSILSQVNSEHNVRERPELLCRGISLREWLVSSSLKVRKNDRLFLFRLVVEIVDSAHRQNIALLELRPSNIILHKELIKYIGPLMEVQVSSLNLDNTRKRGLEADTSVRDNVCAKMPKVGGEKLSRPDMAAFSAFNDEGISTSGSWLKSGGVRLENCYACPEGLDIRDLFSFNIYCLGLLLFEFLYHSESMEAHSAAMLDLSNRIFPPSFLCENPREAGFCFWLLHPVLSSRPTTREILQSELLCGFDNMNMNNEGSCDEISEEAESDLLLHFLVSLKQQKENKASDLQENVEFLDMDIKEVLKRYASIKNSDTSNGSSIHHNEPSGLREKLLENINQLANAYFSIKSNQPTQIPETDRPDRDILSYHDRFSWVQTPQMEEKKCVDRVDNFFNGLCKFARYNRFEVCGALRNGDILNSNKVICSMSMDREEDHVATAGVSKQIKVFEVASLMDDHVDVQYPVLEMSNSSKFSCICWNSYITNYLASSDYEGIVQIWDVSTGQGFARYMEHQARAWSVNFSQADPTRLASGGDDCSLRIWNINERNSTGMLWSPANICCVQFSRYSSHLLAFGSADYRIYCYDLRHTRIPWCTLAGHGRAVSYVRFLDPETIVSASTDNTLKLWDLKKTNLEGLSPNACNMTFTGHTNERNFVGLAVLDGYIACGSETNEVFAYYKSFPMPITTHKFGASGDETSDGTHAHFISSLCWRKKTEMLLSANSSGGIKVLKLV